MESILSIHEEVYPLKSRRKKSSSYLSNTTNIKINTLNRSNIISFSYQYIKTMITERSVYLLGILILILACIAIICVTQAEDHPEYFSLVYISISVFIFYMGTILFIIIIQIIETYQERHQKNQSSLSTEIPLVTQQINIQSNPIPLENMTRKIEVKTSLARSQTLSSVNPHDKLLTVTASSTLRDFNQITSPLLSEYHQSINNYQSFALTTNDRLYSLYPTVTNTDSYPNTSSLIKPIPLKYHVNNENNKSKVKFSEY